jgi:hypothetical protein
MDNIWLYGQGTLFKYNKSANTWDTSISEQLGLTNVGVDRNINGMAGDRAGNIWIGSDQMGLLRYDINTHKVEPVQPINMNDRQMRHETVSIQSLYVDDTDLLWIGTEKSGVAYSGQYIYRFASLLNGDITAIAQADSGKVWYGTSDNGVYLVSADNNTQIHHFTIENSKILSNNIESIAINPTTGEVFFGTDKGLCSFISDATETNEEMTTDNVWAYPNPVNPGYTGLITVTGLSYNADVKILSSSGVLITEGKSNGGSFTWDGNDRKGNKVASGIYMVVTAKSNGDKGTVCKIAIVR